MEYKVGDKVRVRKDLKPLKEYGGMLFLKEMEGFLGEEVIIKSINGRLYKIFGDVRSWNFTDEMFEDETISVTRENLMNAYNSGCSDVKKTLEKMYPDVFKKKKVEKVIWVNYYESGYHSGYVSKEMAIEQAGNPLHTAVEFRGFVEE